MVQQYIHGTRYIDELVMMRVTGKGDMYVHQAEGDRGGSVKDWNVIGLTDLGGTLVERHVNTPYGIMTVHQESGYGDRDGDGDVDATDKGTPGTTCTGTVSGACRILDLDFDGDYDATDATAFDSLPQGLAIHPGRSYTGVEQPFGHQGLLFEPEIGSYQNRARQYDPVKRRFAQRDPLALMTCAGSGYQDGVNLYSYVRGNPSARTDAGGLQSGILWESPEYRSIGTNPGYDKNQSYTPTGPCCFSSLQGTFNRIDHLGHCQQGGAGYPCGGGGRVLRGDEVCGKMGTAGTFNALGCFGGSNGGFEQISCAPGCVSKNVKVCGCLVATEHYPLTGTWRCPNAEVNWVCSTSTNCRARVPSTPPTVPATPGG